MRTTNESNNWFDVHAISIDESNNLIRTLIQLLLSSTDASDFPLELGTNNLINDLFN